jgi:chromosome segregation ATPase
MVVADLVIYAVLALFGAVIGWAIRQSAARSKEAALKISILDAKSAVPKLESSIRNRDQQVSTLEDQVSTLRTREHELTELLERQRGESANHERQLRNANSELEVLRTGSEADGQLYTDDHAAPAAGDSDLVERAARAEERYESLKRGLIERDDRILELEGNLEAKLEDGNGAPVPAEQLDALETDKSKLRMQLGARDDTIKQLNQRLEDEAERREVLESLAKRRGEAKLEQREKLASYEAELPALRKTLAERDSIITQRVATIASLRDQIDALENAKVEAEANAVSLTGSLVEREHTIAEHDTVMDTMIRTLEAHKGQIETLTQRNARTDDALRAAERIIAERDADIAARQTSGTEVQGAIETLKGTLRDRDFKIEDLQTELVRVTEQLSFSRDELAQSATTRGQDLARLETESRQARQRATDLQQEKEHLEARVLALESAASADDQRSEEVDRAVNDRDLTINALEGKLRDAQGQIDSLAKERADLEAALKDHQDAAQNVTSSPSEPEPAAAADDTGLREAEQRIRTLENSLKDRDFRIDSLLQDAAALQAKLEVYRAEDQDEVDAIGAHEAAS